MTPQPAAIAGDRRACGTSSTAMKTAKKIAVDVSTTAPPDATFHQKEMYSPTTPAVGNLYRPVDTANNPNLQAETADTYNVGLIVQTGPFRATLDYFKFKFKNELTTETGLVTSELVPAARATSEGALRGTLRLARLLSPE